MCLCVCQGEERKERKREGGRQGERERENIYTHMSVCLYLGQENRLIEFSKTDFIPLEAGNVHVCSKKLT